ncbi:DUF6779 domain-containing protein [Nakamurella aerolata]|uniref:DUF6779 domain-containing protein n=1 Tax=Nakamurella aerolata TaxID=1656892 RepID=A0A849A7F8_9ACTN|nr:DUF6779 domain-containing protein [Nakamurella aerolata]NNG34981.1 hypothetical protein [Nakamurella aerolata]
MSSTAPPRRRGSTPWSLQLLLLGGFVFGAAATVLVVLFADQVRWLRIAVLLALWAALFAAFAVARSRREAQQVVAREDEITRTYQLHLQREVSARREYETALSDRIRDEVAQREAQELAEVRAQLARLSDSLSQLMDGDVLVERLTLSAEATRLRGIPGGRQSGRLTSLARGELAGRGPAEVDAPTPTDGVGAAGAGGTAGAVGIAGVDDDVTAVEVTADLDAVDAELVDDGFADDGFVSDSFLDGSFVTDSFDSEGRAGVPDARSDPRPDAPAAAWARRHRNDLRHQTAQVAATRAARAKEQAERADAERAAAELAGRAEAAQREAAQREAVQREAAQRQAAEREAAQREAAQREAAQREAAQREAAQREAAQRQAAEREASQREAPQREAAQREATQREAAEREAMHRDAQREAAQRELAHRQSTPRDSAQRAATRPGTAQQPARRQEAARQEDQPAPSAGPSTFRSIGAFSIAARGPLDPQASAVTGTGTASQQPTEAQPRPGQAAEAAVEPGPVADPSPGGAQDAPHGADEHGADARGDDARGGHEHGGHEIDDSADSGRVSVADLLAAFGSQNSSQRRRRRAPEVTEPTESAESVEH